jgi:hypothetical protein
MPKFPCNFLNLILLNFQPQKYSKLNNSYLGADVYIFYFYFYFFIYFFLPQFCSVTKLAIILFFFLILLCDKTGDHTQEDLAKFGYRPDMKVEFF